MNKKNIILILLAVWGIVVLFNVWFYDDADDKASKQKPRASATAEAPFISLELLDKKPPQYVGVKRDIFRPVRVAVKRVKPKPVIKKQEPIKKAPVAAPVVKSISPVEEFVKTLSFGGFMEKGDGAGAAPSGAASGRTVFLSSGDEVYLLKKGELIDGRFALVSITDSRLRFVDRTNNETASMVIR